MLNKIVKIILWNLLSQEFSLFILICNIFSVMVLLIYDYKVNNGVANPADTVVNLQRQLNTMKLLCDNVGMSVNLGQ
jgi:hypothetical protein